MNELPPPQVPLPPATPPAGYQDHFFRNLIIIGILAVVGFMGYQTYQDQQDAKEFRQEQVDKYTRFVLDHDGD